MIHSETVAVGTIKYEPRPNDLGWWLVVADEPQPPLMVREHQINQRDFDRAGIIPKVGMRISFGWLGRNLRVIDA